MSNRLRGTGRTTNMLKLAAAYQTKNPFANIAIIGTYHQISSFKMVFVQLGGDYKRVSWLIYNGHGKVADVYKNQGFKDNEIFVDHYVLELEHDFNMRKKLGK